MFLMLKKIKLKKKPLKRDQKEILKLKNHKRN